VALERLAPALACVEGAMTMYANSPPEIQQNLLFSLHTALVSASDTCARVIPLYNQVSSSGSSPGMQGGNVPGGDGAVMATFSSTNVDPRLAPSLACVAGAIQMYRNSPSDMKQGMLMALRAALMSAANTCATLVDVGGSVYQTYNLASPPVSSSVSSNPITQQNAYEADIEEATDKVSDLQASQIFVGDDPNSAFLRKVYSALESASGEGNLGLGPISPSEVRGRINMIRGNEFVVADVFV
jgi:hypothetical protein